MSKPNADSEPIAPEIVDQAVTWFVKLSSGSATHEEQAACAQWRAAAPAHERAWQRLEGIAHTAQHGSRATPLARGTLVDVADRQLSRRQVLKKSILLLGLVGGSVWLARQSIPWAFYLADIRTGAAGRRELTLADGSRLLLDAVSAINIDARVAAGRIELISGRLLVTTSPNPARLPLEVITADGTLIPHGTRFSVRRYADDPRTQLMVMDGAVTVRPADGTGAVRTEAGWQITLSRRIRR